jgi:peptidoglycan hydrolase CwlO-like protein
MPTLGRPSIQALGAMLAAILLSAAAVLLIVRGPVARADSSGQLKQQINSGQNQVSSLSGAVSTAGNRLAQLNSSIATLEHQIGAIESKLSAQHAQLLTVWNERDAARARLARLEHYEAYAEGALSRHLVNTYENQTPDLVSVVLEASGFQDLLERLSFAQRISKQDVQIIRRVRTSRRAVAAQATRLGAIEAREQKLTNAIVGQRARLATSRANLVGQQVALARYRSRKAGQLASARGHVADLERELSHLQAAQAAAASRAASGSSHSSTSSGSSSSSGSPSSSSGSAPSSSSGSAPSSSGGFTFPLPKSAASPPGTWSPDQGVDISAPGDTPEYAVCSGTIVLHGIGGFGQWAPVLHCDSPTDGFSYVYYGHAGPANQLPVGTHVGDGQVMSSVGPGIVGISTGPHLEVGFADSSGSPIGPQTASTMMSLLQSSY